MGKLGFYYDMSMCIGCRTCQIACIDKYDLKVGTIFRQVKTFEAGVCPEPQLYHYSNTCNHCTDAKCVKSCPTGAMHYAPDGTVQHDKDKCIGCQYCVWNCPYGVPQFIEDTGIIGKCDSCIDLREKGGNPACVDACVMRCLEFGDLDELAAKHGSGMTKELPILPPANITQPSLLVKPKSYAFNSNYKERKV